VVAFLFNKFSIIPGQLLVTLNKQMWLHDYYMLVSGHSDILTITLKLNIYNKKYMCMINTQT